VFDEIDGCYQCAASNSSKEVSSAIESFLFAYDLYELKSITYPERGGICFDDLGRLRKVSFDAIDIISFSSSLKTPCLKIIVIRK